MQINQLRKWIARSSVRSRAKLKRCTVGWRTQTIYGNIKNQEMFCIQRGPYSPSDCPVPTTVDLIVVTELGSPTLFPISSPPPPPLTFKFQFVPEMALPVSVISLEDTPQCASNLLKAAKTLGFVYITVQDSEMPTSKIDRMWELVRCLL